MLTTIVARIVAASCRHAKLVVLLAVIASAIATYYSVTHFAIDTDSSQLISKHLPWRQHEAAYNKAFPQNNELILVVVDGVTPERAQEAAQGLVDKLSPLKSNFDFVELPSAEPFFGREGLLFKNLDEVKAAADRLDQANPLLSTLAYDPTLRGIASAVQLIATGVVRDKLSLEQAQPLLSKFANPMDEALVGKSSPFSWQSLFLDPKDYARGLRRFVLAKPKLNFDNIEPGGEATDIIRKTIGALKLDPSTGVTVRLTGEIPLNDEAFSSVREGFALNSIYGKTGT